MASKEKYYHVDKLNNTNYRTWAFQMMALFEHEEVAEVITQDKPAVDAAEAVVAAWQKSSSKAKRLITFSVESNQIVYIKQAKDGREAWEMLKRIHGQNDVGAQVRVLKGLLKTELVSGVSMRDHIAKITDSLDHLGEMDMVLSEPMKVGIVLSTLSEDYEAVVTGIEAWDSDRLTMANIRAKLVDEYDKKQKFYGRGETSTIQKEATAAVSMQRKVICFGCGQPGHFVRHCTDLRSKLKRQGNWKQSDYKKEEENNKDDSAKLSRLGNWYFCNSIFNEKTVNKWLIDSGASNHMSNERNSFKEIDLSHRGRVVVANGDKIDVIGRGQVDIELKVKGQKRLVTLSDVLLVPKLDGSLVSVNKLTEKGLEVNFKGSACYLRSGPESMEIARQSNGLYVLNEYQKCFRAVEESRCVHSWHKVLGHRNLQDIRLMRSENFVIKDCECSDECESCIRGKMARKPFPQRASPTDNIMDLVVSDVCGPIQVESVSKKKYFVTFVDVCSGFTVVEFLRERSEVPTLVIQYVERMKTQLGKKPKTFRTDRGTEYMGSKLQDYLKKEGIQFQCTVGYAPEQNGVAERMNRTLMEAARTMLIDSGLPKSFWAEAILNACYTMNRIYKAKRSESPYETMFKKKPKYLELNEFGRDAYVMIPDEKRRKLDDKAVKMKFVGYDEQSKGYRLVDRNFKLKVNREVRFVSSRDLWLSEEPRKEARPSEICFDLNEEIQEEDIFYDAMEYYENVQEEEQCIEEEHVHNEVVQEEAIQEAVVQEEPIQEVEVQEEPVIQQLRRTTRVNAGKQPDRFKDYESYEVKCDDEVFEPRTYKEAITCKYSEKWKEAMKEELESIEANETWELTYLPSGRSAIGSKWVFKIKQDENGNVVRRKARLVAQGFSQQYGVDYDEVFAPVVRNSTFRLMLSEAGVQGYKVKQYDIKSAFLNGNLDEEIYMKQPAGFSVGDKVYKLKKSLYGLKQAARVWNQTLHEKLMANGCIQSETDKCLYFLKKDDKKLQLLVHVDDILVSYNDDELMEGLMSNIGKSFEMKDLGQVSQFLEISVTRSNEGNFEISQPKYIEKIIKETGQRDAKEASYPLDTGYWKLGSEEKVLNSNEEFRKIIGMLLYLATNSRPDISASVSILSQRVMNPRETDLNEAKRVVRYLKGTKDLKLKLSSSEQCEKIFAYSDANWAEDRTDRKSNSGYLCKVNGGTISWSCRKQDLVALSSTEAEYVALSETSKELCWLQRIAKEMEIEAPMTSTIYTDSQSAMSMINNQKFSNRTKHIDTRHHYVRDKVMCKEVELKYKSTDKNVADMLTKPLGPTKIKQLRREAGLN